jgi:hypothetical protein
MGLLIAVDIEQKHAITDGMNPSKQAQNVSPQSVRSIVSALHR